MGLLYQFTVIMQIDRPKGSMKVDKSDTWPLKGVPYHDFKAHVCTILVSGPLG